MNPHTPAMSVWLILAIICWGLAALHNGYYWAQPEPRRWGFGLSLGWLGLFFYGLFVAFGR